MTTTSSITTALGAGSGIDTAALVTGLVEAQFAAKTKQLTARSEKLDAQISGLAKLRSGITTFDSSLRSLVRDGSLQAQPSSSNPAVLRASTLSGARVGALSGTLEVKQLATAQAATTRMIGADERFDAGQLRVWFGSETEAEGQSPTFTPVAGQSRDTPAFTIDVAQGDSLEQVAAKINGAGRGLTATVISDGDGARVTIKGQTGATQAFRIAGEGKLAAFDTSREAGAQTTIGTVARSAVVTLDGATFTRSSNNISNLLPGVRLELTATGSTQLGTTAPTAALTQAMNDLVSTYNEMLALVKAEDDPVSGALRSDSALDAFARGMRGLTTAMLAPSAAAGAPRTLADLGVRTARDGTLSIDNARLTRVLTENGADVEAVFAPGGGVSEAIGRLAALATDQRFGFDASTRAYSKRKSELSEAKDKLSAQQDAAKTRLTRQFSGMDARVAAYKATQTFMENQVKAWNRSDD